MVLEIACHPKYNFRLCCPYERLFEKKKKNVLFERKNKNLQLIEIKFFVWN